MGPSAAVLRSLRGAAGGSQVLHSAEPAVGSMSSAECYRASRGSTSILLCNQGTAPGLTLIPALGNEAPVVVTPRLRGFGSAVCASHQRVAAREGRMPGFCTTSVCICVCLSIHPSISIYLSFYLRCRWVKPCLNVPGIQQNTV